MAAEDDSPGKENEGLGLKLSRTGENGPPATVGLRELKLQRSSTTGKVGMSRDKSQRGSPGPRKEKKRLNRENNENRLAAEKRSAKLGEIGQHDSGANRALLKLWEELNPGNVLDRRCIYTGEQISIERLFSGEVEIDHILPFTATLDDSNANKLICLREANRRRVLDAVLVAGEPTQSGIAAATGLAPATVSNIVRHLVATGSLSATTTVRGGRRVRAVRLVPPAGLVAGVDFGHRHVRVGLARAADTVPRAAADGTPEPPPELLAGIFPWVEDERAALDARQRENRRNKDIALEQFLGLLVWLRRVLVQDLAVLSSQYPGCAILKYAPFNALIFMWLLIYLFNIPLCVGGLERDGCSARCGYILLMNRK